MLLFSCTKTAKGERYGVGCDFMPKERSDQSVVFCLTELCQLLFSFQFLRYCLILRGCLDYFPPVCSVRVGHVKLNALVSYICPVGLSCLAAVLTTEIELRLISIFPLVYPFSISVFM